MYVCERRSCFVVCYHLNNPNTEQEQVSGAAVGSMDGGDDEDEEDVTVWRTTMKLKYM